MKTEISTSFFLLSRRSTSTSIFQLPLLRRYLFCYNFQFTSYSLHRLPLQLVLDVERPESHQAEEHAGGERAVGVISEIFRILKEEKKVSFFSGFLVFFLLKESVSSRSSRSPAPKQTHSLYADSTNSVKVCVLPIMLPETTATAPNSPTALALVSTMP